MRKIRIEPDHTGCILVRSHVVCGALCIPGNRCEPGLPPDLVRAVASPCSLERNHNVSAIRSTPVPLSLRTTGRLWLHQDPKDEDPRTHLLQVTHRSCYTCEETDVSACYVFCFPVLKIWCLREEIKEIKYITLSSLSCSVLSHVDFSFNIVKSRQSTCRSVDTGPEIGFLT